MKMGVKKLLLLIFLGGFIYHLVGFFIHTGYNLLSVVNNHAGIHLLSAIISLILFVICYKIISRGCKTSDEEHHKINKIR